MLAFLFTILFNKSGILNYLTNYFSLSFSEFSIVSLILIVKLSLLLLLLLFFIASSYFAGLSNKPSMEVYLCKLACV